MILICSPKKAKATRANGHFTILKGIYVNLHFDRQNQHPPGLRVKIHLRGLELLSHKHKQL